MKSTSQIRIWVILLIFSFVFSAFWPILSKNLNIDELLHGSKLPLQLIQTFTWFCVFQIVHIILHEIIWNRIFVKKINNQTPELLKFISTLLLFSIFASIVTNVVFEKPITGFLAISGGMGIMLGFALQNSIIDFFSGIVLHLEKPFALGDFIMLNSTGFSEQPLIGKVVSINWRTTRLEKTDGILVIVPNNQFTKMVLTNFMLPEAKSRMELEFCIGIEEDPDLVTDTLLTALNSVDRILKAPKPKVKIPNTTLNGVIYQVRYWVLPKETSPGRSRDLINRAVLKHLRLAGISLAHNRSEIFYAKETL